MKQTLCTACKEQPATCETAVDYRSDTAIAVCGTCQNVLCQNMRNDFYNKFNKAFYQDNKDILKNAQDELFRQYELDAKKRDRAREMYRKIMNSES